jgi:hypothetical protein
MNMKVARRTLGIVLVVLALTAGLVVAAEEQPLNNADIINLTKLDMGDEVIISKIKTAKAVKFETSTDDLVKLKESGVSGPVIKAMLERSVSGAVSETPTATGSVTSKVALVAKEGNLDIKPITGDLKIVHAPFVGMVRYIEFSKSSSATRIKDHYPTLLLYLDHEPHNIWWLVKLKPWNDQPVRILELPSMGHWGGTISDAPNESCNVQYTAIEEKPGLWRITLEKQLDSGEYGLFSWEKSSRMPAGFTTGHSMSLYDFGVDK